MFRITQVFFKAGLALALVCGSAGAATPAPLPTAAFFSLPQVSAARLSPDGQSLALLQINDQQRYVLMVVDLRTRAATQVASFQDSDIGPFEWVNNERLVFHSNDRKIAPGDQRYGPGLYAIGRDGSDLRVLAERSTRPAASTGTMIKRKIQPWNTFLLGQAGAAHGDSVYVLQPHWDRVSKELVRNDLLRLDTRTGASEMVDSPGPVLRWLLDATGQPRLAIGVNAGRSSVHYLDPATGRWRKVAEFAQFGDEAASFEPLGFSADGKLYVVSAGGGAKTSVRLFDLERGQLQAEPLLSLQDFDFSGQMIYGRGKLLGLRVLSDARSSHWLDPQMRAAQQQVDALLPATVNLLSAAQDEGAEWLLVTSYSDVQPAVYQVFNLRTKALVSVGGSHPDIDPARMGKRDLVRYGARDGLSIPAWLTLPAGGGKQLPLVVLVHGGPFVRGGEWAWRPDSQFLASRGYAVLEPEFRGSTGYGQQHFQAGWKQWGLAMQDDIADGARWAIAQGIADPCRICIAGASYGGYAALMGLIKDPELFQCGVSWSGVSDIGMLFSDKHSLLSDIRADWQQYGMPQLVADPVADAAQLQATSPLAQVARLRRPLLIAHGGADHRVPIYQAEQLVAALRALDRPPEWIRYENEGHGWSLQSNQVDFWTRVDAFLARHIGPR